MPLAIYRRRPDVPLSWALPALLDSTWTTLDLSGASDLKDSTLHLATQQLPLLKAIDLTGCSKLSAMGYQQLGSSCPQLEVLRVGGGSKEDAAVSQALRTLLPGILRRGGGGSSSGGVVRAGAVAGAQGGIHGAVAASASAVGGARQQHSAAVAAAGEDREAVANAGADGDDDADDWEELLGDDEPTTSSMCHHTQSNYFTTLDASASNCTTSGTSAATTTPATCTTSSSSSRKQLHPSYTGPQQLQQLQTIIWKDPPVEAVAYVLQRCPRVVINPALKPNVRTGAEPLSWWDPAKPLDEEAWGRVGPGALQVSGRGYKVALSAGYKRSMGKRNAQRNFPMGVQRQMESMHTCFVPENMLTTLVRVLVKCIYKHLELGTR